MSPCFKRRMASCSSIIIHSIYLIILEKVGSPVDFARGWSYNLLQTMSDGGFFDRLWSVLLTIHPRAWYHSPAKSQPQAGILFTKVQETLISANEFRVNEGIRVPEVRLI